MTYVFNEHLSYPKVLSCSPFLRPTLEQVSRVVREAEALGLAPDSDPLLAALSEQQSQARGWVEGSKQLLDTLKALAQNQRRTDEEEVMLLVRRAQSHMEGARRLSLKVGRAQGNCAG